MNLHRASYKWSETLAAWCQASAQEHCKAPSHHGHLTNDSFYQLCVPPCSTGASQCHTPLNHGDWQGLQTQSPASSVRSDSMIRWFPGEARALNEEWEIG